MQPPQLMDYEWKLDETIFASIAAYFYRPKIELFASRLNYQLPRYVAWQPDPGAEAVDAFTLDWRSETFFAFPPFSLLGTVVQKNRRRSSRGKTSAEIAIQPRAHSSPAFKVSTSGLLLVRESLCEKRSSRANPSNHHGILARLHPKTICWIFTKVAKVLQWTES